MTWWMYEIVIYLFLIVVGAFLIEAATTWKKQKATMRHRNVLVVFVIILIISWLVVFYGSFIEPRLLVVNRTTINLVGDHQQTLKAIAISDLHVGSYKKEEWARRVVETIMKEQPDIVFILGDFVSTDPSNINYLDPLNNLDAPLGVFAVTGNHEHETGSAEQTIMRLEEFGINVLENEQKTIEFKGKEFTLVGISDIWFEGDTSEALDGLVADQKVILLVHNPDIVLYPDAEMADLVIAGHTHGGQIRLPFIGPVPRIPNVLGRAYDQGFKLYNNQPIFITSGLGETGPRARLFNPPEIAVLYLNF